MAMAATTTAQDTATTERSSATRGSRPLALRPPFDDILAGLTVALVLIPQSLAYAALAGLPPIAGLIAAIFPPLVAALFASSPYLQTGPTALTALLTLGVLAGSFVPGSPGYLGAAALLALLVGVVRVLLGLLRFGTVAYFMSLPVMRGFTSGAAVLIIASQLPAVFGRGSEGLGVWRAAWRALSNPASVNLIAVALAVGTYLIIRGSRRLSPLLPGVLVAAVVGVILTAVFGRVVPGIGPVPTPAEPGPALGPRDRSGARRCRYRAHRLRRAGRHRQDVRRPQPALERRP